MKGRYEQAIERLILEGISPMEVNWINMSPHESEDGGADRCTDMLVAAGYRPDKATVAAVNPEFQDAYANGQKVGDIYIRLPQETWRRRADENDQQGNQRRSCQNGYGTSEHNQ